MKNISHAIQTSKNRIYNIIVRVKHFPKMSFDDLWFYKLNAFKKLSVLCEMEHPVYSNVTAVLWCYAHFVYRVLDIMWVRIIYWYYYVYYIDQLWTQVLVRHVTVYRSNIILNFTDINLYDSSPKSKRFVHEYILRYWFSSIDCRMLVFQW